MANRCARCQQEDVTLETFGVFRCPACGRVDADGRALDAPPPAPGAVASGALGSFDAPPPWVPPDVAERARAGLTTDATQGPPTWLFGAVLLMAIVSLASAVGTGAWIPTLGRLATLVALASGRSWARLLSIAGSGLSIVGACVALTVLRPYLPASAGPVLVVILVAEGAWLYVLFREDTVRYFSRA
ncbi:MAG: hypothetical protein JWM10_1063 [Myxococcaceae bacterium]|nr:hypothetical protein [Myxococcaceae bacterium]